MFLSTLNDDIRRMKRTSVLSSFLNRSHGFCIMKLNLRKAEELCRQNGRVVFHPLQRNISDQKIPTQYYTLCSSRISNEFRGSENRGFTVGVKT